MLTVATLLVSVWCAAGLVAPLNFKMVDRGDQSVVEDRREVVVRTAAEWAAFWKTHAPARPRPAVDFSKAMVVGIFVGTRPTGGHSVEITRIERQDDALVVTYREQRPATSDIVTQILTSPYVLVMTDRFAGPVRFVRSTSR